MPSLFQGQVVGDAANQPGITRSSNISQFEPLHHFACLCEGHWSLWEISTIGYKKIEDSLLAVCQEMLRIRTSGQTIGQKLQQYFDSTSNVEGPEIQLLSHLRCKAVSAATCGFQTFQISSNHYSDRNTDWCSWPPSLSFRTFLWWMQYNLGSAGWGPKSETASATRNAAGGLLATKLAVAFDDLAVSNIF